MTTDKSQPTGWVVVRFDYPFDNFFDANAEHYSAGTPSALLRSLQPFRTATDAEAFRSGEQEVHPWPLPASVLARLKERHPTVDWSQVPVADAPVEKPGRWVVHDLYDARVPYRDQRGQRECAGDCTAPWATKDEVEGFIRSVGYDTRFYVPVNLDELPSPAVAEPSEVEDLRAEVTVLKTDLAAYADQLCAIWALLPDDIATQGGPAASAVRGFIDRLVKERDELREELSRCKQAHSAAEDDVESLREQLGKTRISRLDEFAKAALTGTLAQDTDGRLNTKETAEEAVRLAQATIRALDGAGGA